MDVKDKDVEQVRNSEPATPSVLLKAEEVASSLQLRILELQQKYEALTIQSLLVKGQIAEAQDWHAAIINAKFLPPPDGESSETEASDKIQ